MASNIRIGNQTAFSASLMEPLEFAVEHGFEAFEWFADRKTGTDDTTIGWHERDLDGDKREEIRRIGKEQGILYTVHAPWQANPLEPDGDELLRHSIDFAEDIDADLVNLHLCMERGSHAYVDAMAPIIAYAAHRNIRLSIENTPLTGPEDFNLVFAQLDALVMETGHVGMCLDLGHTNLFADTRNDYIRYIDRLAPTLPIIHLHVHENWGDRDSHLPLFTGPAGEDDTGVRMFIERIQARGYRGAMILEQWPQPPTLLVQARDRLRSLLTTTPATAKKKP